MDRQSTTHHLNGISTPAERVTRSAASSGARGLGGLVISGAVRDSAALDGLDVGVKARGTHPRKSSRTGAGVVDGPVEIGGVWIRPGWTVHSDGDGIVVVG